MMKLLRLKHRRNFIVSYLRPLLQKGLLIMTNPESPTSPKQRYITTKKGFALRGRTKKQVTPL